MTLALREALSLHHNYIGTEHILLGLIREGDGVAAQILRGHGDLLQMRMATIDLLEVVEAAGPPRARRWTRRVALHVRDNPGPREGEGEGEGGDPEEAAELSATPAADETIAAAARLAGGEPVGSHHLLLAALTDANSAAARVLASLGVDLSQAKDALHNADISGTTDELPEEAGRRQMNFNVTDELLTIVVADQTLVKSANAAVAALGEEAAPGGTIRGADLAGLPAVNLARAWTALRDALSAIATSTGTGSPADTSTQSGAGTGTGD